MRSVLAALALLCVPVASAWGEVARTQHAETELVSARVAAAPGETVSFVLRQKPQSGWHTYWINPGDSGEPPRLEWTAPQGYVAGPLIHPAPVVERLGPITTYVHDRETLYPVALKVPETARPGERIDLSVRATWLICDEICVPESGTFPVTLAIAAEGRDDARGARLLAEAVEALPETAGAAPAAFDAADPVRLDAPGPGATGVLPDALAAGNVRNALYFPYNASLIDHAAPAKVTVGKDAIRFEIPRSLSFDPAAAQGEGLVVAEVREGGRWAPRAFMFGRPPGEGPVPAAVEAKWSGATPAASSLLPQGSGGVTDLLQYVLLAFLGGLILNVMPCVFPVLSIKALSLAGAAQSGTARRHGLLFLAGVMATFLLLAVGLLALKAAGTAAGWGFQLQEPLVVAGLALLFFVIGLNLIGAFDVGGGVQNLGSGLAGHGGDSGAFFTGALAVIAATPCTAPFMAGALGWAVTQPAPAALAVFAGLGLGFAAPFTLLSFAPGLQKLLPRPGAWMDRLKQALAFPMFATTVWLVYVLAAQAGAEGVAAVLALLVAVSFLVWTLRAGLMWRAAGVAIVLATAAAGWSATAAPSRSPTQSAQAETQAWSAQRVAALTAEGKPVFVNFTAAWCVTCKANEITALSRPAVKAAFERAGVVYLKGDWTARDSAIAAELAVHGRDGVPLYLYYPPGAAAPRVLPQLLTEQLLIDTVSPGPQAPGAARNKGGQT